MEKCLKREKINPETPGVGESIRNRIISDKDLRDIVLCGKKLDLDLWMALGDNEGFEIYSIERIPIGLIGYDNKEARFVNSSLVSFPTFKEEISFKNFFVYKGQKSILPIQIQYNDDSCIRGKKMTGFKMAFFPGDIQIR